MAKKHQETWDSNPPPGMGDSLRTYTSNKYWDINGALRAGETDFLSPALQKDIANIDAAMAISSAPVDFVAYRGVGDMFGSKLKRLHEEGNLVGATLSDKGYTSTSVERDSVMSTDVVFHIKVRKGQPGAFVREVSKFASEEEFLLPRDTALNVSRVQKTKDGNLIVDVDILPVERRDQRTKKGDFGWAFDA